MEGLKVNLDLEKLNLYYNEYHGIDIRLKEKEKQKEEILKELKKTKEGKFYLKLSDEAKQEYRGFRNNTTITRLLLIDTIIKQYEQAKKNLELEIAEATWFPFNNGKNHIFIEDNKEFYDALTGESTKDLDIALNLKEFIKTIISKTYKINEEYSIDDLPLIKLTYENFQENCNIPLERISEFIFSKVKRLHSLDERRVVYNKVLNSEKLKKIKMSISTDIKTIKNSDSFCLNKDLALEEAYAVKFELLMLQGYSVVKLYRQLEKKNQQALIPSLIKAYYNLTNINYRRQSNYFMNEHEIICADFETANYDINAKILEMKINRKK